MTSKSYNDLNLNLLKKLKPSAESKDFASAAKRLNTTSGALSLQLNQLESALGIKIFERKGIQKTTVLTTEGKRIYELYSLLDDEIKSIIKGEKLNKKISNKIKVTTTSGLSNYIFCKLYKNNPKVFEKYSFEIESSQNKNVLKNSDFLIRADIAHKEYVNINDLLNLTFCLYASSSYIEKYGKPINLGDLKNHRIISSNLLYYYDSFSDIPYKSPINNQDTKIFVSSDANTLINLCKMGMGITELPVDYPGTEELVSFVLSDYKLTNKIYIAYNKDIENNDYRMEFLNTLIKSVS